ncbi:hypothetical protein DFH06DRAFT_613790 [Mycena polygramma]|nr:hypothetical protein DFH06DRAFT_613790 [Mycena polygramma]
MAPGDAGGARNRGRMNPLYGRTRSDDEIQRRCVRCAVSLELRAKDGGAASCIDGQYMRDRETRAGATKPSPSLLSGTRGVSSDIGNGMRRLSSAVADKSLSHRPDTPSRFPCPLKIAVEVEWEAEGGARMLGMYQHRGKHTPTPPRQCRPRRQVRRRRCERAAQEVSASPRGRWDSRRSTRRRGLRSLLHIRSMRSLSCVPWSPNPLLPSSPCLHARRVRIPISPLAPNPLRSPARPLAR